MTDPTLTVEALDQTVAAFDTVEELLKHFNPDSWQEDLENLYTDAGHHFRGRSYHDRKSKGRESHGMNICINTSCFLYISYQCSLFDYQVRIFISSLKLESME